MAVLLLFDPLEITVDAIKDSLRLAFAKLSSKPYDGNVIVFRIVTSTLSVTKRDYVCFDRARIVRSWIAKRYPVISSKCAPQAARPPAYRAFVFEVFNTSKPIILCKTCGEMLLSRVSLRVINRVQFWVRCLITLGSPLENMRISLVVRHLRSHSLLFVAMIPSILILAIVLYIILSPFSGNNLLLIRVIPMPIVGLYSFANATVGSQAACHLSVSPKVRKCSKPVFIASRAVLKRIRQVQHSVSLSLNHMLVSASGVIDRLSVANLADNYDYTTERGATWL